jgi:hypothetical protein
VIELKTGRFKPEYAGQLGFYIALVDEELRRPTGTPPASGSCCALAATNASCATPLSSSHRTDSDRHGLIWKIKPPDAVWHIRSGGLADDEQSLRSWRVAIRFGIVLVFI